MYKQAVTGIGLAAIVALAGCQTNGNDGERAGIFATGQGSGGDAQNAIRNWPEESRKAADAMIDKYGQPDEITGSTLTWHNNGPWKRTQISREPVDHHFPMAHKDVLEQTIDYRVPPQAFTDLAFYDGSVIVERTKGEMSARCDKEEANFLALNLAHDIIQGRRSVDDARAFYAQSIKELMQGNKSEYTQSLMFRPMSNAGDPDKPAPGMGQGMGGRQ